MNSSKRYQAFLEALRTPENSSTLDAVVSGWEVIRSLYESADSIKIPQQKVDVHFRDDDAYAFIYLDEKDALYLSGPGMSHGDMILAHVRKEQAKQPEKDFWDLKAELGFEYDDNSEDLGYHGRLWLKPKVISFWKYPSVGMFQTILSKLKEQGVSIDETWRIEVKLPDREASLYINTTLIPIGEYVDEWVDEAKSSITQEELDMLRELHTMDPIAKAKLPKGEVPVKDLNLGEMSMAERNYLKKGSD